MENSDLRFRENPLVWATYRLAEIEVVEKVNDPKRANEREVLYCGMILPEQNEGEKAQLCGKRVINYQPRRAVSLFDVPVPYTRGKVKIPAPTQRVF